MHSGTTTVHSSQNVETAQMSISEWMDFKKKRGRGSVHPVEYYSAVKKEKTYSEDEPPKHYSKWKKANTKKYILHDAIYMKCPE